MLVVVVVVVALASRAWTLMAYLYGFCGNSVRVHERQPSYTQTVLKKVAPGRKADQHRARIARRDQHRQGRYERSEVRYCRV